LQTRTVIGYEALARGPEGTDLYTPDALFAAARARGTFGELDCACRIAAFDGAVKAHLPSTLELFVNVEAAALNAPPPPGAAAALSAAGGLSVVIELTERDLTGTAVRVSFASFTRWKACTLIAAVGRYVRMAFANAADGSVATTSILSPEAGVRAASQAPTPVFLRPTSTPRTRPVSRSPIVEIHGSCRRHLPVGNRK